ncbi:MAG TPA: serine/threonine protein kinase [Planctomycetes bacterium]|nr:serine/threonine protein kinase [Planctomycetota bacterium]
MAPKGYTGLVGSRLGSYEIRTKLGEGGMGAVYLAHDASLEREVAIKVLPPEYARDGAYVQRFEREAKSLARLRHPNLIHIYTVGAQDDVHYFAMELIRGETLAEYMRKRGPLEEQEVLQLAAQILSALHSIHRLGIMHRDIKAANIMLDGPGHAVLMDFGLAKDRSESGLTTAGAVLGTPEYMAPEQAQGDEVSPATDIYSFGVLLYEMLAGRLPFLGEKVFAVLRAHIESPPPPLEKLRPGITRGLARIVYKALEKNPAKRYASAAEMARDMYELAPLPQLKETAGDARSAKTLPLKPVPSRAGLQGALVIAGVVVLLLAFLSVAGALKRTKAARRTQTPATQAPDAALEPVPPEPAAAAHASITLKSGGVVSGRITGLKRYPPDRAFLTVETEAGERSLPFDEISVIEYR